MGIIQNPSIHFMVAYIAVLHEFISRFFSSFLLYAVDSMDGETTDINITLRCCETEELNQLNNYCNKQ